MYNELRIVTIHACMVYTVQWKHMYVHACTASFSPFSTYVFFHYFSLLFQLLVCYTHNLYTCTCIYTCECNEERRVLSMHNELPIVVVQSKKRVYTFPITDKWLVLISSITGVFTSHLYMIFIPAYLFYSVISFR